MHGRAIRDAKDIREEADYGIGLPMKKEEAHKVLEDSSSIASDTASPAFGTNAGRNRGIKDSPVSIVIG